MKKENVTKKLYNLFKKNGVVLAYLFGSQAQNTHNQSSDIDIAVLFKKSFTKKECFEKKCRFLSDLSGIFTKPVDITILNDTHSDFFNYVIIKEGIVLFELSQEARISFEQKTLNSYFDFEPFLSEYNAHYVKTGLQQNRRKTSTS